MAQAITLNIFSWRKKKEDGVEEPLTGGDQEGTVNKGMVALQICLCAFSTDKNFLRFGHYPIASTVRKTPLKMESSLYM